MHYAEVYMCLEFVRLKKREQQILHHLNFNTYFVFICQCNGRLYQKRRVLRDFLPSFLAVFALLSRNIES